MIRKFLFAVVVAYVLQRTNFIPWLVFSLDYLLGNPSPLRSYRDRYMSDFFKNWPIPPHVHIPSQPFQEILATNYSHEAFRVVSEKYTKPVIIRGIFSDSKASQWTPEFMAEKFGENRTFVSFVDNRFGSGQGLGVSTYLASVPTVVKNISAGGNNYIFNANFEYPTDLPLYQDIGVDRLGWRKPAIVQFFLGLARPGEKRLGGSPLHAAVSPNINVQLKGHKKWIMIDPKYAQWLRPTLLSDQFAVLSGATASYSAESRWNNYPRYESEVHPGDAIFIPSWWFHEVHNIQGEDWQISLALRYADIFSSFYDNWLFTLLVDIGLRNKPCIRGFRLVCLEFFEGWEHGSVVHKKSLAGEEGPKLAQSIIDSNRYE